MTSPSQTLDAGLSPGAGLRTRPDRGRGTGFTTMVRHEGRLWWGRRWLVQAVLWTVLLDGLLLALLWIAEQAGSSGMRLEQPAVGVAEVFPQYLGVAVLLSTIGVVVLSQSVMLDERRDGTLEWVLSKPVSRTAIVLAKFTAHVLPILLVVVVVPWAGVYGVLSWASGAAWPLGEFAVVVALVGLLLGFTVALTLLLGTWTTSRGLVIGVPIAAGMVYDGAHALVRDLAGQLPFPWELTTSATAVAAGAGLVSVVPVVATVGWIVAVVAATAWRFEREEVG
ncbi:ABC transporter permease subunit [Salsipaludibacter albus]|uniref:ABC transporter permease subunit n=1 Tax=Salsipaludibacter albus TaxID=2849650 RepID=UPI001EE3EEFD|nr:ABC transporter permease subunit [Salsipaludibacter albus]MBY5162045.1 ABC transporter permease subunit [Salsipaludibacter albus]